MNTLDVKNSGNNYLMQTGNHNMNQLLNDRFEIESIRQEQGYFKQKLESIKNDINVMKQL